MPGFNVAGIVTSLVLRLNFAWLLHFTGMQKPRRSAQAKA